MTTKNKTPERGKSLGGHSCGAGAHIKPVAPIIPPLHNYTSSPWARLTLFSFALCGAVGADREVRV